MIQTPNRSIYIKKGVDAGFESLKTYILVVTTSFFQLENVNKWHPGCCMNKIKNMMNVTINVLKILSENYNKSVTNI